MLLNRLPAAAAKVVHYVEPLEGEGLTVYEAVCRLQLEGIVSKRIDAPYCGGRSNDWVKVKCRHSDTFVVIGFSTSARGRLDGLHLASAVEGELVYAGKVERGFTPGQRTALETPARE